MTADDKISHLDQKRRQRLANSEDEFADRIVEKLDARMSRHFQERNELLLRSVGQLMKELDGVRRGESKHAFAKIAPPDCQSALPTITVDASILFPHTGEEIGRMLGLTGSEVGTLLGPRGLNWAGDPRYQEVDRWRQGRTRFWHQDVPGLLKDILEAPSPGQIASAHIRVQAIVRKYRRKKGLAEVVALPRGDSPACT